VPGIVFLFFIISPAAAQIYKWVDKDGRVHFSDRPIDTTAQKLDLRDSDGGGSNIQPIKESPKSNQPAAPQRTKSLASITASDYTISSSIRQQGDVIIISGRIEGGPECPRLNLSFYVRTGSGGIDQLTATVENAGGFGSKVFEARKTPWPKTSERWVISNTYATCN
jgi:hypothetical protein